MDTFNWMVNELLTQETLRDRRAPHQKRPEGPKRPGTVTRALASSLVRLGLRLDPAAGEGQGRRGLALAQQEVRR